MVMTAMMTIVVTIMMTMVMTNMMAMVMTMMKVMLSPTADAEKLARLDWVRTTVPALEYVFRFVFVISIEIKIKRSN